MKSRKALVVIVLVAFIFSLTACAAVPVVKSDTKTKTARQLKFEQDEEARSWFIKGISAFSGMAIGGLVGLLAASKGSEVGLTLGGALAGGGLGFLLGMVIFDNTKPGDQAPDDKKIKEYFQDYRNIQLKE